MRTTLQQLVVSGDCVVQLGHFWVETCSIIEYPTQVRKTIGSGPIFSGITPLSSASSAIFAGLQHNCETDRPPALSRQFPGFSADFYGRPVRSHTSAAGTPFAK